MFQDYLLFDLDHCNSIFEPNFDPNHDFVVFLKKKALYTIFQGLRDR